MSTLRTLAALALGLTAAPSLAQEGLAASPLGGSFELRFGNYRPNVDKGPFSKDVGTARSTPWADVFGTKRPLDIQLQVAKSLPWRQFGTFEVGVGAGWFRASGFGLFKDGTVSSDKTTFSMVPLELSLTYRLDLLMDRLSIPLVPYARASLERYGWWISGPHGTSQTGATNGYSYGGGLGLVLDVFDEGLARELDHDTGINHTMVIFDVKKTVVDDFGSTKSWDLSDTQLTYSFGLLFVF